MTAQIKPEIHNVTAFADIAPVLYGCGLFDNLIHDECSEDDFMIHLGEHPGLFMVSMKGEFGGVFTIDDLGEICGFNTCEVHAYILPCMRRYSIAFMKEFAKFIFDVSAFDTIITTVPDHSKRVVKVLEKMVGFKKIKWEETKYKKNGNELGQTYLILKK